MTPPVLAFEGVTLEASPAYDSACWDVSFALRRGDLLLVRLERDNVRLPLADAACGLLPPDAGVVRFGGVDWSAMSAGASTRARARVGRVFEGHNWVSNLDVDENVMLAQRHHTRRPDAELVAEAAAIAKVVGLPGLPRGRPSHVRRQDLSRAALVRALMGKPELLILERPEAGVFPEIMPPLINVLRDARKRGAAVMWLTNTPDVWRDRGVRATLRATVAGAQVVVTEGEPN